MNNKTNEQQSLLSLTSGCGWDVFLTLSFTGKRTMTEASKTLRQLIIHLERKCFGRSDKRLVRFPVIEHTSEATHFHILLCKPDDKSHDYFRGLVVEKWKRLTGCGWANLRVKEQKFYQEISDSKEDRKRVTDYITKYVDSSYETVDFENTITI
jgi:hypothetical protein